MTTVKRSNYIFSIVSLSENFCFDESGQQRTILVNMMILNLTGAHFLKTPSHMNHTYDINMSTGVLGLVVKLQTLNLPWYVKLVPDASHAKRFTP